MENTAAVICAPRSVNVTVRRPARPREYLTEREIEKLMELPAKTDGDTGTPPPFLSPTATVCVPPNSWPCVGMISTSKPGNCTFGAPRAARPAFTRSEAENYAPCGG